MYLKLKQVISASLYPLRLLLAYWCDYCHYFMYSRGRVLPLNKNARGRKIIMLYHAIEKGLSLPHPKEWFGQSVISKLLHEVKTYEQKYGTDQIIVEARIALNSYCSTFDGVPHLDNSSDIFNKVMSYLIKMKHQEEGSSVFELDYSDLKDFRELSFPELFKARKSVRSFSDRPVVLEDVIKAIEFALWSPSVCNRQPWRVHIITSDKNKEIVTSLQNGCSGFGDKVPAFLFITSPTWAFSEVNERNQGFFDCGLFSMSLSLFLQYFGIGSCFLNWAVPPFSDKKMRKQLGIPPGERGVCFLSIGYPEGKVKFARSQRLSVDEFVQPMS